ATASSAAISSSGWPNIRSALRANSRAPRTERAVQPSCCASATTAPSTTSRSRADIFLKAQAPDRPHCVLGAGDLQPKSHYDAASKEDEMSKVVKSVFSAALSLSLAFVATSCGSPSSAETTFSKSTINGSYAMSFAVASGTGFTGGTGIIVADGNGN